jgi:hypothetical protein
MQKIILAAVIAVIVIMLVLIIMLYRKRVSAGVFNGKKIRDLTTGHCLFVDGAAPDITNCNIAPTWSFTSAGAIVNDQTGLCLEVGSKTPAAQCGDTALVPMSKVIMNKCNGSQAQQFKRNLTNQKDPTSYKFGDKIFSVSVTTNPSFPQCLTYGSLNLGIEPCRVSNLTPTSDPRSDTGCNMVQKWLVV